MNDLQDILAELGISKVKLAKYLGVSRQMVYNYLEMDDINRWPKEKKILLFKLLDIKDGSEESLANIKITTNYLLEVEGRLNNSLKQSNVIDNYFDLKDLTKEEQVLINDITFLIKEKFTEEKTNETYYTFLYLYQMLQCLDNVPEIKYIFAYMSKENGFIDPNEFKFDETAQFMLESILFSALNLYNNGGATKGRLLNSHRRFVEEIEARKEEKLSRTQELNTIRIQALKELGYTEVNTENASEVFEKIAEIESRKDLINKEND